MPDRNLESDSPRKRRRGATCVRHALAFRRREPRRIAADAGPGAAVLPRMTPETLESPRPIATQPGGRIESRRPTVTDSRADVTMLLRAAASGQRSDLDALMTAIYDDLRRLASAHMKGERGDHTLQPTALVHEAYVKLIDQRNTDWKDRLHFFAVAARVIRRILIDRAREHRAAKRGGAAAKIDLSAHDLATPAPDVDLIALDEALAELAEIDPQQARIVELRFFGGCTIDEVADVLQLGKRTVDRGWQAARAWLLVRIEGGEGEQGHAG